jgi:hypothetical protein
MNDKELDRILVELNKPIENGYLERGDDEAMIKAMIKAVTNAANYYNGKENTFLEDYVQVKSSYTKGE